MISSESSEFSVLFTDSPLRVKLTVEWVLPLSEVTIISFESLSLDHFQESLILNVFYCRREVWLLLHMFEN